MKFKVIAEVLAKFGNLPLDKRIEKSAKALGIPRGILIARIVESKLQFIDYSYGLRKLPQVIGDDLIRDMAEKPELEVHNVIRIKENYLII